MSQARSIQVEVEEQDPRVLAMQNQVLELVASRSHCQDVFDNLCLLIEHESPGAMCTILVVDRDGERLRKGAGPSVSPDYMELLDGLPIAPEKAGSCGAAAYSKRPVICADVASDPLWSAFRDIAERFNIGSCWSTPFFSSTGSVLGTFAIAHDHPCEPTAFQSQLLLSASFLAGIAKETQLLDAELANTQRLESIGVLAGGIAHDFNNLSVSIMGNIDLARSNSSLDPDTAELLDSARAASLRARDVTQQLLTFAGGGAPVTTAESVREVLMETIEFTLSGSNVSCKPTFAPDLKDAEVDKGQISQVIQNVILNAMQAMPAGGTISVHGRMVAYDDTNGRRLGSGDEFIEVAVTDNGVGIPAEHLERVFDPYFSTKQSGRGLGLSTAYSIMKRHGGWLDVESTLGQGTTAFLYLPVAAQQRDALESLPAATPVSGTYVLVMDDDDRVRTVLAKMLSTLGCEVVLTSDGDEAIERYEAQLGEGRPFDLAILDLTVRGGTGGLATLHRIKKLDSRARAIATSGYAQAPVMANHAKHGFAGRLSKPYTANELSAVLSSIMAPGAD